jgi:hypothetical protein
MVRRLILLKLKAIVVVDQLLLPPSPPNPSVQLLRSQQYTGRKGTQHAPLTLSSSARPMMKLISGCSPTWLKMQSVKVILKGYRIRRALASAHTLCPFPEYSPLFQNTILIISEDPDGYCSISEGPDDYHMISGCRDKYHIPI